VSDEPTVRLTVRLPASLHDELRRHAEVDRRSLNSTIVVMLTKAARDGD
jgi:hypothetical protein